MWKKALWVYTVLYLVGMVGVMIYNIFTGIQAGAVNWAGLPLMLLLFLPGIALAIGLGGKKVPLVLVVLSLLIAAVPVAGIFTFNDFSLATVGKFLIFVPLIVGLIYFGFFNRNS